MMHRRIKFIFIISMLLLPFYRVNADSGGYIVKFNTDISNVTNISRFTQINNSEKIYTCNSLSDLTGLEKYIEYYETNDRIELIEDTEEIELFKQPSDELYSEQWQAQMINADSAWELETYGNDIRIGVIDSGCYPHDDLKNNLMAGWNYLSNSSDVSDNNGHGTHVSGIIAAEMNDYGIVGTAPKSKIIPLKCFDPSTDTYADTLIKAIYDAVDKYKCQVINMSWGLKSDNVFLEEAINYAYDKGVILVAAVGNKGTEALYYPAAYENVIGVGSVGMYQSKSVFSQQNKSVFVVAPGEKVKSTYKDNSYAFMQGTSQATPFVSAIAAIALSADDSITNDKFKRLLSETSNDLGELGCDPLYGYGLINTKKLLNRILTDIRYYVSPINIDGDNSYVLIKNNSNDILMAKSVFAIYDNDVFKDCAIKQITLLPDKTIHIKMKAIGYVSHFLWSDTDVMNPLSRKREMLE